MSERKFGPRLWALVDEWLRATPGANQTSLARSVGVSRSAVSQWAVGAAAPSAEHLGALSGVMGVPYATLVTASLADRGYLADDERLTVDEVGSGPREPSSLTLGESSCLWRIFEEWASAHEVKPSLTRMAEQVGIRKQVLSKWRAERVWTGAENLRAVSAGLGVPYRRVLLAMLEDTGFRSMVADPFGDDVPVAHPGHLQAIIDAHLASFRYPPEPSVFAAELGVSAEELGQWCEGGAMPSSAQVRAVSEATGVPRRRVLVAALMDGGYLSPGEAL